MASLIQIRRGLEKNLPTLNVGEPALATDTRTLWVGSEVGNILFSRDLAAFAEQHAAFLDEATPLINDMLMLQRELDVETLKQLAIDLKEGVDFTQRIEDVEQAIEAKVDRVPGKYLSTNDYTDAEKTKLGGLYQVIVRDSVTSTSQAEAASAASVKKAYDEALLAKQQASDGKTSIAAAITGKGVSATGSDTFAALASKITSIPTGTTGTKVAFGSLAAGGGTINAGFPIKLLVSLNVTDNEVVTLAPAAWNGFGVGQGYDYTQGRTAVTWSGNTAVVSGAHFADPMKWIALG